MKHIQLFEEFSGRTRFPKIKDSVYTQIQELPEDGFCIMDGFAQPRFDALQVALLDSGYKYVGLEEYNGKDYPDEYFNTIPLPIKYPDVPRRAFIPVLKWSSENQEMELDHTSDDSLASDKVSYKEDGFKNTEFDKYFKKK